MATPAVVRQPQPLPAPSARKPEYHFRDRVVVTGPFTRPYEIDPGRIEKKTWPWQTTSIITSDSFVLQGIQKLSGGICSVNYEAKVVGQAKIEHIQRLHQLRSTDELAAVLRNEPTPKRVKTRLQNTIERELGTTRWDELITEAGLLQAEQRINDAVLKDLEFNNFGGTCICNLSEPAVHGLDVDGKPPRLILGADAGARLKAETHNIVKEELIQLQQHASELEIIAREKQLAEQEAKEQQQQDRDLALTRERQAAELKRTEEIALAERNRKLELDAETQERSIERVRNTMVDAHERAAVTEQDSRQEFDAARASEALKLRLQRLHDEKQEEMRLEANLRENQLAARPLDEQFVAYETDMMKHDLDRARVEQEKKDLQRRAEQEAERGEIELLRDRAKAEHAWEIERLDLQAKAVAHALEKMSSTSQPIERLTIMQSPGDVGALPNSPMYLLSQAALVIRELFSLVGDRK